MVRYRINNGLQTDLDGNEGISIKGELETNAQGYLQGHLEFEKFIDGPRFSKDLSRLIGKVEVVGANLGEMTFMILDSPNNKLVYDTILLNRSIGELRVLEREKLKFPDSSINPQLFLALNGFACTSGGRRVGNTLINLEEYK